MAITIHPSIHVHPGPWLKRQVVEPFGIHVKDLAAHFGVSRQNLSNVLNGHTGLTAEMAIRFEQAFGLKADTLIRMQSAHDLAQARMSPRPIRDAPLASAA
jgi:addiction module HigA family antidote